MTVGKKPPKLAGVGGPIFAIFGRGGPFGPSLSSTRGPAAAAGCGCAQSNVPRFSSFCRSRSIFRSSKIHHCPSRFLGGPPGRAEQAGRPGPRGRWGGDGDLPRGGGAGSRRQWPTRRGGCQVGLLGHVQPPVKGRRGLIDEPSGPQPPRVRTPRTRARRPSRRLEMTATGAMRAPSPAGAARSV